MDQATAIALVTPFYDALTTPAQKDVAALVESVASPSWRSFSDDDTSKGRDEFVAQVRGFGKVIPDLRWEVREVLVAGDRIVVRSRASGTPVAELFGVPASGRTFSIMTIDVHTVREGRLVAAHHVEDWASALRQLRG